MDNLTTTNQKSPQNIIAAWNGIQNAKPGIRIRDAATSLGLSEAQLLATKVGGEAVRLNTEWNTLLKSLPELGSVMSLTRNEACVLEHKGIFSKVNVPNGAKSYTATVRGPIETRAFLDQWYVAFAVKTPKKDHTLVSIQVFDYQGDAVTKIFLRDDSNHEIFERLVADLKSPDQSQEQMVYPVPNETFHDHASDAGSLLKDWSSLKDTHDFASMLKHHHYPRYDAMEQAEGSFTYPLKVSSLKEVLEQASDAKLPIMIFAGNRGNIQIHQDKVRSIRIAHEEYEDSQWLNVLDPNFNMHLRIDLLKKAWVVKKPTKNGNVTSIECYDHNRNLAVQFFGVRKRGMPELEGWRNLVENFQKKNV